MFIPKELKDEIVARNDIVDVLSEYISLKKSGSDYVCCCPFHNEKTPSFHVSRERQRYKCFGCETGGGVITFLMKHENMTFPEAVKNLADRVGIDLPERELTAEEKQRITKREKLFDINLTAAGYFHYILVNSPRGKSGYEYFKNRGITDETIKNFGLGYADVYRDDLYKYLKSKGYSNELMRDAGLVKFDEKYGPSDMFWNRVIVPITDMSNNVIAFGGRVLGDAKPKYLNTRETEVFNKSRNLFAMYTAKTKCKKGIILCEGYMDVIAMHQAGFQNSTASLGTAFTEGQASIVKKYTSDVYLAYDSDGAGTNAAMKAISILRKYDMSQKVINLKPYKDPDEFIKAEGAEAFEERIKNAINGRLFEIDFISSSYNLDDPEEKTKFMKASGKLLAGIDDKVERSNYIEKVATKYYLDKEVLKGIVSEIGLAGLGQKNLADTMQSDIDDMPEDIGTRTRRERKSSREENPYEEKEMYLFTILANNEELVGKLSDVLSEEDFTEGTTHEVAKLMFDQYRSSGKVDVANIICDFEDLESQEKVSKIFTTDFDFDTTPSAMEKILTDLIIKVKTNNIDKQLTAGTGTNRIQLAQEKEKIKKLKIRI